MWAPQTQLWIVQVQFRFSCLQFTIMMILDDTPIQKSCRRMGNFLCGVERVKRCLKVHLHCIFSNLKKDNRNIDVAPPWKNFCGRPWSYIHRYGANLQIWKGHNYLSSFFCDFPLIARSGKWNVTFSFKGCAPHTLHTRSIRPWASCNLLRNGLKTSTLITPLKRT